MALPTTDILKQIANRAEAALAGITDSASLEAWRVEYLGRKGAVPQLLRQVKELSHEERKEIGKLANELREKLQTEYAQKKNLIDAGDATGVPHAPDTRARRVGVSLLDQQAGKRQDPHSISRRGHLHPLTQSLRRAQDIFAAMGFQFVEGPDIEETKYNFDYLNIDQEHPARAETDTFYLKNKPELVLRTSTSPLQIRGVEENTLRPPFKIFYYGTTFRSEKEDATHGSVFNQYEFMVVDENVNLADLKSIVQTFYSLFFGRAMEIRFRPGYFPFVEPGLEVDMRDKVTKKGQWLEMAGAGMVHPTVLKNINVDPAQYQGIALGGGLERLALLQYGIPDLRLFYSGNIRFLQQF